MLSMPSSSPLVSTSSQSSFPPIESNYHAWIDTTNHPGIGITPFASILGSVVARYNSKTSLGSLVRSFLSISRLIWGIFVFIRHWLFLWSSSQYIKMFIIFRLELIWVNRDYTGLDWFLHLLKSAEACPLVNISVHLLSSSSPQLSSTSSWWSASSASPPQPPSSWS